MPDLVREQPRVEASETLRLLVALIAMASATIMVAVAPEMWRLVADDAGAFTSFLALTLGLQLLAVDVYGRGRISASGIGVLATGFAFGVAGAMTAAILAALVHALRSRAPLHKKIFNAAAVSLAGASGALAFQALDGSQLAWSQGVVPALAGGALFWAVNVGLVTFAMSLEDGSGVAKIWIDHFRWLTIHYISFGPLALACTYSYEALGLTGLLAFSVPPALVIVSVQQYLRRTRESVEEVRRANEDLRQLFEFAAGLAARAHERSALTRYVEGSLQLLVGGTATVDDPGGEGIPLVAAGAPVASLRLEDGFDEERWERLRDAVLPHVATALESADLVEQVKKTHLDTIAALSKSMEAKDYYTGGHTERVSDVAVALARRLGYSGADLEAIEIGALLHDIGKIGIPERILHKPGPLDPEEWKVMKDHPVISDYILSEVELNPIVRQIARSSHERIDGTGYPDGLVGDDIPLPARIVLVADAFDALTSDRPYRSGRHVEAALGELLAHAGTQFCSRVVAALEDLYREEPHILGIGRLRAVKVA